MAGNPDKGLGKPAYEDRKNIVIISICIGYPLDSHGFAGDDKLRVTAMLVTEANLLSPISIANALVFCMLAAFGDDGADIFIQVSLLGS